MEQPQQVADAPRLAGGKQRVYVYVLVGRTAMECKMDRTQQNKVWSFKLIESILTKE